MLTYLNSGIRDYYNNPVRTIRRGAWEFQAVIEGEISPVFINSGKKNLQRKTLWVFPPDFSHGWDGKEKNTAEIIVFHFSIVAGELNDLCQNRSYLSISLTEEEILQIKKIYQILNSAFLNPGKLFSLKSHIAVDQLSLLICSKNENFIKIPESDYGRNIVEKALALFSSEMHHGPDIIEISKEVGVSSSHLRRLFHKIKGANPRTVLEELRMTRAMELACFTSYTFLEIANTCGFSNQSAFTKAFCRYWNTTPTEARKEGEYKTNLVDSN